MSNPTPSFQIGPSCLPLPLSQCGFSGFQKKESYNLKRLKGKNPSPVHAACPQQAHPLTKELLFFQIKTITIKRPQRGPSSKTPPEHTGIGETGDIRTSTICVQKEIIMVLYTALTFPWTPSNPGNSILHLNSPLKCAAPQDFWALFYSRRINSWLLLHFRMFLPSKTALSVCLDSQGVPRPPQWSIQSVWGTKPTSTSLRP